MACYFHITFNPVANDNDWQRLAPWRALRAGHGPGQTRDRLLSVLAVTILLGMLFLSGCTTLRKVETPRSATQQLLISTAADRSADRLTLDLPPETKVFVNAEYFEGLDSKYAIGAIRDHVLKQGARLVTDKKDAEVVIEIRAGALSVDERNTLLGIPSFGIPIPLAGTLQFPELALFKVEEEQGVSKVTMTGYDTKNGKFKVASGPAYGFSHRKRWTVLFFFSWSGDDLIPPQDRDKSRLLDIKNE